MKVTGLLSALKTLIQVNHLESCLTCSECLAGLSHLLLHCVKVSYFSTDWWFYLFPLACGVTETKALVCSCPVFYPQLPGTESSI